MKLLLAATLLALAFPAAAVYRCASANGKTSFQEVPCAAGQTQTEVRTFAAPSAPDAPGAAAATGAPPGASVNEAIGGRYAIRGMNLNELQMAMGDPVRIETGDYEGGYTEQRIYERPGGRVYVYTENGIVRSIQTTQSTRVAQRDCPSALEIRNEEVSANSISLTPAQRRERLRQIRRMKACND
jgi:hypothetical protein